MSSEKSKLTESIDPDLLDTRNDVFFNIKDSGSYSLNEVPVFLENPFKKPDGSFVPASEEFTFEKFIELASDFIQEAQAREGIVESERVQLVEEWPYEEFNRFGDEVVTWRLKQRSPAKLSTDGRSRPQRHFQYEKKLSLPTHPNKIIEVEKRLIDHTIEFSCWSKRARLANKRALWLERLFVNHSWVFTSQGADRFFWKGRGIDTYTNVNQQPLYQRTIMFDVRLAEFRIRAESVIRNIGLELNTSSEEDLKSFSKTKF